jgi:hypothetical protein
MTTGDDDYDYDGACGIYRRLIEAIVVLGKTWGKVGLVLLVSLFLLVAPVGAQESLADDPAIEMQVTAGWDGLRKVGDWVPVQVTLQNNGTAVETRISISSGIGRPNYTLPVSLPNQSNKRVMLYVHLPNAQRNLIVNLFNEANGQLLETVRSGTLTSQDSQSLLYGVVSSQPDILPYLARLTGSFSEAGVAYLEVADLPAEPGAWDSLDVLVWHDADMNQLSAEQRAALRAWVGMGGQLVITAGPNWQRTTTAVLEMDMLPVTPTGLESIADLPSLALFANELLRDPGPYPVTTSTLNNGQSLIREGELPILAVREYGRGRVYFLALDPTLAPLKEWAGNEKLWGQISNNIPAMPMWGQPFINEDGARTASQSLPALDLPSSLLIMLFLCTYVLLVGPMTYALLHRLNRKELAWVTIPLTIVAFTAVAYLSGLLMRGNEALVNQASIIFAHASAPEARFQTAASLYSPRRVSYDVTVKQEPLLRSFGQFGNTLGAVDIRQGLDAFLADLLVDIGGLQSFNVNGYLPTPPITGEVRVVNGDHGRVELTITITNNSDQTFEQAIALINDTSLPIGDLAPGESQTLTRTFTGAEAAAIIAASQGQPHNTPTVLPGGSYDPLSLHYPDLLGTASYYDSSNRTVYPRYQLLQSMVDYYGSGNSRWQPEGIVTLIGWGTQPPLEITLDNQPNPTTAITLYFIELPYR